MKAWRRIGRGRISWAARGARTATRRRKREPRACHAVLADRSATSWNITRFLLEVGGDEFFIDLLFHHLKPRRYVVVELEATPFQPDYAGQLNFYLSAVDARLSAPQDQPTIGLLPCREKNRPVAEYALRGMANPMGVAESQRLRQIPASLESGLPSIDRIEAEPGPDLPAAE
ncbi:PDDEXK nuclease domain-containing protein [Burkholderia sp. F1]|uniref:PDDEXK nuclease domain-containing protein n=1 Tax=Burkholderia sp. F1 TaxID=3366817 RepID=UPI003D739DCA